MMLKRDTTSVVAILFLVGCGNNLYQANSSTTSSTQTTNTFSTTSTTGITTGSTTTETTQTTPTTTTTMTTGTTNTTITTKPAGEDCHAYDPLDIPDWTRLYDVNYNEHYHNILVFK